MMDDYLKSASLQCSRCSRNNTRSPAVEWCEDCCQSLCETCVSSHRRDPTTHLHTITDLPQTSVKQPQLPPCCEHSNPVTANLDKFELSEIINYQMSDDEKDPLLNDIAVLEVEGIQTIVVTDNNNKCLKSLFTRNNKPCNSRLVLDNIPFGISQLKDKVMVTLPLSSQIVTVAVTPDLQLLSTTHTTDGYVGLASIGGKSLVAGGSYCVDILNMEGEVMKSISTPDNTDLFSWPYYMCVSNTGHLLLSDYGKKRVTYLTPEGEQVWTYTGTAEEELEDPQGITTTTSGDILVVDRELKKVIQLSASGEYVRDVVICGLECPQGICVDTHGSLFVCDKGVVKQFLIV